MPWLLCLPVTLAVGRQVMELVPVFLVWSRCLLAMACLQWQTQWARLPAVNLACHLVGSPEWLRHNLTRLFRVWMTLRLLQWQRTPQICRPTVLMLEQAQMGLPSLMVQM